MGRLISSVGAALGLTPSEHVTLEKEQTNKSLQPKAENQNAIVEDCTSCKIVGSTVMSGCGIYCMVTAWRNPKQLSGSTLRYLRVAGFAMGTCNTFKNTIFNFD